MGKEKKYMEKKTGNTLNSVFLIFNRNKYNTDKLFKIK
jgi:hypothetical protein